jgi:hypothetical protein
MYIRKVGWGMDWIDLAQDRAGGGLFKSGNNFRVPKMWGIS